MKMMMAALLAAGALEAAQHKVVPKDTLWGLSGVYYGKPLRWREISQANPQIKDPHWIYPGQMLEIPDAKAAPLDAEAASPVETAAPAVEALVPAAAPDAPAAPPPAQPSVKRAPPAARPERTNVSETMIRGEMDDEGLSVEMPPRLAEQDMSAPRVKVPRGWQPEGTILEGEASVTLALKGGTVSAQMTAKASVSAGERLSVYRLSSARDSDTDAKARYMQRVGSVKMAGCGAGFRCTAVVLESGGAVQAGDWIKREKQ